MSKNKKISPEKIIFLQQWLIRQKNLMIGGYALATLMLIAAAWAAHDHQAKYALRYAGIGLVDCIIADKLRKKHHEVKETLNDWLKKKSEHKTKTPHAGHFLNRHAVGHLLLHIFVFAVIQRPIAIGQFTHRCQWLTQFCTIQPQV